MPTIAVSSWWSSDARLCGELAQQILEWKAVVVAASRRRAKPTSSSSPRRSTKPSVNAISVVFWPHGDTVSAGRATCAQRRSARGRRTRRTARRRHRSRAAEGDRRWPPSADGHPRRSGHRASSRSSRGAPLLTKSESCGKHRSRTGVLRRIRQRGVAQRGHRRRCSKPMTGDIADHDQHLSIARRDYVIPVASHIDARSGRHVACAHLQPIELGQFLRQQARAGASARCCAARCTSRGSRRQPDRGHRRVARRSVCDAPADRSSVPPPGSPRDPRGR